MGQNLRGTLCLQKVSRCAGKCDGTCGGAAAAGSSFGGTAHAVPPNIFHVCTPPVRLLRASQQQPASRPLQRWDGACCGGLSPRDRIHILNCFEIDCKIHVEGSMSTAWVNLICDQADTHICVGVIMSGGRGGSGSLGGVWLRGASAQQHGGRGHVAVDVPLCVHCRQLARQGVDDFQRRRRDLKVRQDTFRAVLAVACVSAPAVECALLTTLLAMCGHRLKFYDWSAPSLKNSASAR